MMNDLLQLVDSLRLRSVDDAGLADLKEICFVSCKRALSIRHVPFYTPCLILVLSGRKVILDPGGTVTCDAGQLIAVPAPASFDLRNEPDPQLRRYFALVIPFRHEHLATLGNAHAITVPPRIEQVGVLRFDVEKTLLTTVMHYLETPSSPRLVEHRLMEILLVLLEQDPRLFSFLLTQEMWSQKVRAILSSDLCREWALDEVCQRLGTSESSLRRHLVQEHTGFRELLQDVRLSAALSRLLGTGQPVNRIASDCGYQSTSRFTANFKKRFGLTPTDIRAV
ncbi:helix-turn-helix transcriptional regulator [Geomesophilobacter sediminis]|uniref:Helix-turn-helix transcriptional regulator n=1 Tax=Geomesophilobacter sediminis TaxID=2798584 RepID=A0A8J7IZQ2_9BACT|nr:AraC family transcriptional regulator [Geomesophilobacter sediminis]MBJ6725597.1 helix-turn-helix transcriptional regulator [Geomesophilobacter sediminis]